MPSITARSVPRCKLCESIMVPRDSHWGVFYSCSKHFETGCNFKMNVHGYERAKIACAERDRLDADIARGFTA